MTVTMFSFGWIKFDGNNVLSILATMSTFRGGIREIPGIRVDYFENPEQDTLYFLSHCHTDHMVGIASLASFGE